ncbi:MAG: sigma-70 family RNA polymerase sigma factor [Fimbriimonadales bacterium]
MDEEARLVERCLSGDASAFEVLYTRYYEKVFALARGIVLDADDAADAVQEIFTLAYRNLHRFDRRAKFGTWLYRIAVNQSIQLTRRNRHKRHNVELNEALATPVQEAEDTSDPKVQEAMGHLAPQDRAILTLFYWDELSLNEIGATLHCNENAAKTRLYRARERFRQAYEGLA